MKIVFVVRPSHTNRVVFEVEGCGEAEELGLYSQQGPEAGPIH